MSIYIKDAGSWRLLPSNTYMYDNPPLKVKANGIWNNVVKAYVKESGSWYTVYTNPQVYYYITGSSTITVPRGVTYMEVVAWGAGGGGGCGYGAGPYNGGAGGAGGYVRLSAIGLTTGDWGGSVSYTVGSGGAGGATGVDGGRGVTGGTTTVTYTHSVSGLLTFTANGGTGGQSDNGSPKALGGTGGSATGPGGSVTTTGTSGDPGTDSLVVTITGPVGTTDNYYSTVLNKGQGGSGKTSASGTSGENGGVLVIFR